MADYEYLIVDREGPITVITINRPDVHNAMHPPTHEEFETVFADFETDDSQRVAIITGAGDKAFSAGNDLKYVASGAPQWETEHGSGALTYRYDLAKPVIAAVNGLAMGGGLEVALSCDLIIAAENARFALPEPRIGIAALGSGIQRLVRQIGTKAALGMILTGRHVPAAEALALGLVNEVVAEGQAVAGARRWAEMMLECAPGSLAASKQVAYASLDIADLATAIDNSQYPAITEMFESGDAAEGALAFVEKRPPRWSPRATERGGESG